jgi:ABC-type taurine transport system substrate-binding protein
VTRRRYPPGRGPAIVVVAALAAWTMAGCSEESPTADGSTTTTTAPIPCAVDAEAPAVGPRIAWQPGANVASLVKARGGLDDALGVESTWAEADAATALAKLADGSADVALVDSISYATALAANVDTAPKLIWVADVIGAAEQLVTRGPMDLAGVSNSVVGAQKRSTAGYSFAEALIGAAINPWVTDWRDLGGAELVNAWNAGEIDAAYASGDALTTLLNSGASPLLSSTELAIKGRGTFHFVVASSAWLSANPQAAASLVCSFNQATLALIADPASAAADAAGSQASGADGVNGATLQQQFVGYSFLDLPGQVTPEYLNGGLVANLQSQIDSLGGLANIEVDVTNAQVAAAIDAAPATAALGG